MPFTGNAALTSDLDVLVPSAPVTATGNSGPLNGYGPAKVIRAQLEVTAVSGTTPTLDVVIEDTLDGVNWNVIGTFTQATVATRQVLNIATSFAETIRVRYTVGGTTPSFTFSVRAYFEGGAGA